MEYKGKRWEYRRSEALRRDDYLCRQCLRYGKHREASTAHHVWPADEYPEYAFCLWNLLSLCSKCHNAMHDRNTNKLTALGLYWKRKTIPPSKKS